MSFFKKKSTKYVVQGALLVAFFVFAYWLNTLDIDAQKVEAFAMDYGYIGIFFASIISGFNLLVPIPVITLHPFFVDIGLSPILTVLVISIGMVFGDMLGYFIGMLGREAVEDSSKKMYKKMKTIREKSEYLLYVILFLYAAFVPLPNELLVIPMSMLGISFLRIMPVLFIGNILFNSAIAFGLWHIF